MLTPPSCSCGLSEGTPGQIYLWDQVLRTSLGKVLTRVRCLAAILADSLQQQLLSGIWEERKPACLVLVA